MEKSTWESALNLIIIPDGCHTGFTPFSAILRTPVLSSPSYGIFSPRSGEDSYALVNPALIAWRSGTGRKQAHCWYHTEGNEHQDQVLGEVKRVVNGRGVERK